MRLDENQMCCDLIKTYTQPGGHNILFKYSPRVANPGSHFSMMHLRGWGPARCKGPRLGFYNEHVCLCCGKFSHRVVTLQHWDVSSYRKPPGEVWHILFTFFYFLIMKRRNGDEILKGQLSETEKDKQNSVGFLQHDSSNNRLLPLPLWFSSSIQCISHWKFYIFNIWLWHFYNLFPWLLLDHPGNIFIFLHTRACTHTLSHTHHSFSLWF